MSVELLLKHVPLPDVVRVAQSLPKAGLEDLAGTVGERVRASGRLTGVTSGQSVAIGVGSRGIKNLPLLVRALVEEVKRVGGRPFVVPAMGSHGGATAAGQVKVLANLGVTEEAVAAPIKATMATVEVGRTPSNLSVYVDQHAWSADAIVVVNVIKPHVAFRGRYESGLMKMIAIGLGKQRGAEAAHDLGFGPMATNIVDVARVTLSKVNVICAVGVLEDAYGDICHVEVLAGDEIEGTEPMLLERAKSLAPRLLFDRLDVLVIDEIGKDIAGTGFDTNVTGRFHTPYASGGPDITRIVVLDLTDRSGGNANGIGLADFTTRRVFDKMRMDQTYPNALTSTILTSVKIPMVLDSDSSAIRAAIKTCNIRDKNSVRLVRITNTKRLEHLHVSTALMNEVREHPSLSLAGEAGPLAVDDDGNLF